MRIPLSIATVLSCSLATTFAHGQAVLFEFFGDGEFDIQGYSVAGAGDVNADGTPDFIVGVPQLGTTGGARVYSGMDGTLVWSLAGDNDADWFGYSVAGAGDTDCDGYDDLIVGAPFDDNGGEDSGMARVYSGRTGLLLHQFDGASQGYQLGHSVSGVGDVDGDLCTDFVIGSHLEESGGINPGRARVYSGASGAVIYTFEGDDDLDAFGYAVSGAGDVNHDGTPDIAVGALLNDDSHEDAGSVYVFSGLTGAQLHRFDGLGKGEDFGFDVASAGDVDGDDYADVIGGTIFGFAGSVPGAGQARVYSGRTGTEIYRFDGDFLADGLGWSVSDIGDINGDQFGDLVVGAPFNDDNGGASGLAKVYSGATGAVLFVIRGEAPLFSFGRSVASAGDVDGDNIDELVIGVPGNDAFGYASGSARVVSFAVCNDGDGDGYGNPGLATCPAGPETDCDDADASVHPGALEIPGNSKDDDCNPATPGGCTPAETVGGGAGGSIGYLALAGVLALMTRRRRVA